MLGAVLGFFGARAAAWRDRRALALKVARNLSQETKRVREELGKERSKVIDVDFDGLSFDVPTIHPWMNALVPEAATISGDVVGRFMTLDRELHNLKILLGQHREAHAYWVAMGKPSATDNEVDRAHRDCAEVLAETATFYHDSRSKCFALLADIDALLRPAL
jgi:hypothetical protein